MILKWDIPLNTLLTLNTVTEHETEGTYKDKDFCKRTLIGKGKYIKQTYVERFEMKGMVDNGISETITCHAHCGGTGQG